MNQWRICGYKFINLYQICQWKHWEDSIAKQIYETNQGSLMTKRALHRGMMEFATLDMDGNKGKKSEPLPSILGFKLTTLHCCCLEISCIIVLFLSLKLWILFFFSCFDCVRKNVTSCCSSLLLCLWIEPKEKIRSHLSFLRFTFTNLHCCSLEISVVSL